MNHSDFREEMDLNYCRASMGKRFANYIIDLIVFYVAIIMLAIVAEILSPGIIPEDEGIGARLISLICYALLMFVVEAACHGKSLGKVITGTRAVNSDGSEIDFQKSFVRNIVRAIPFNAFSAFGTPCEPWHDKWSDTIVIDEKLLDLQCRKETFFTELKNQTQ